MRKNHLKKSKLGKAGKPGALAERKRSSKELIS
jgi:hypothetical protein